MSHAEVDHIIREIEQLSEDDRDALAQRLAEQEERDWQLEASSARDRAKKNNLDQAAIDQAIEQARLGR